MRVLVTGSAGRVGRAATKALVARGHQVTGFDLRPTPDVPAERSLVGPLTDSELLRQAVAGQNVVIHLAATPDDGSYPRRPPPDDSDNFLSELLPNNILATYHLLEAVRRARVPRLVLASTGQVVWYPAETGPWPLDEHTPPAPRYWYACTKLFLEAAGQAYSSAHGLTVLVVRLGWCPRDAGQVAEIAAAERHQDVYLSPGDAGRFFIRAVETPALPPHALVYASSRPFHRERYSLARAAELLGYQPEDTWPTGAADF